MKFRTFSRVFVLAGAFGAFSAQAQLLKITPNYGSVTDETIKAQLATLFSDLQTKANANLPQTVSGDKYTEGVSNSLAMASGGIGTDYATPFTIASVGGALGVGADLGTATLSSLFSDSSAAKKLAGFGVTGSLVVGFNLGRFVTRKIGPVDLSRLKVWMNWYSSSINQSGVQADASAFGVHATYKLIPEHSVARGIVKWYGLDVGTGFHHSSMGLDITQTVTQSQTATTDFGDVTAQIVGTGALSLNSSINTIPIEVSTGARLLYVLGVYTGLGMDLNFGSTTGSGTVDAPITLPGAPSTGGINTAGATATMDINSKKGPGAFGLRTFAGLAFDASIANIYAQFDKSITNSTIGVSLGARLYW